MKLKLTYSVKPDLVEQNFKERVLLKHLITLMLILLVVLYFTLPIISTDSEYTLNRILRTISTTYNDLTIFNMSKLATLIADNLDRQAMEKGLDFGGPEYDLVMNVTRAVQLAWIIPVAAIASIIGVYVHRRIFEASMALLGLATAFQTYFYLRLKYEIVEYGPNVNFEIGYFAMVILLTMTLIVAGLLYKSRRMVTSFASLIPIGGLFATGILSRRWLFMCWYLSFILYLTFPQFFIPVFLIIQAVCFSWFLYTTELSFEYTIKRSLKLKKQRHINRKNRAEFINNSHKTQLELVEEKLRRQKSNDGLN